MIRPRYTDSLFWGTLPIFLLFSGPLAMAQKATPATFTFGIMWDGSLQATFSNCSFIGWETHVAVVSVPPDVYKQAINTFSNDVRCERPLSADLQFSNWSKDLLLRRDISILLLDNSNLEIARWTLYSAWPSKIELVVEGNSATLSSPGKQEGQTVKEVVTFTSNKMARVK